MQITKPQARRFLLIHQGLSPAFPFQGKAGILGYIRRVGCIQFDPLNIAGQNPDLVLQARIGDYRPAMLRALLYEERALLDGMDKVMSIYPVEDWPFFERWRAAARRGPRRSKTAVEAAIPHVREAIARRGPLSSNELEIGETITWDWGTPSRLSRAVLEIMYLRGELVIHHKVHTRKYYDLAERCLPEELCKAPDPNPNEADYQDWHVLRRVGSVGLLWNRSGEVWLGMIGMQSGERRAALERLAAQGKLGQVSVEGITEPFYYRTQDQAVFEAALEQGDALPAIQLMAPLDNLLWDRRMLKALFDFDYTWEVYTPADRRHYGYYVLPVLCGDQFIARCEPVLDRKRGVLVMKNWWWEAGLRRDGQVEAASQAVERLAQVLGAEQVEGMAKLSA